MWLATKFNDQFSIPDRARGEMLASQRSSFSVEYFDDGADAIFGAGRGKIEVSLLVASGLRGSRISAACTCTKGESDETCEHLYALMRRIDRDRIDFTPSMRDATELVVEFAEHFQSELSGLSSYQAEKDIFTGLLESLKDSFALRAPAPQQSTWRDTLRQVANYGKWDRKQRPIKTKQRQVWYAVNPGRSASADRLAIDLMQREVNQSGKLGKLKPLHLDESEVKGWPEEEHRELLGLLISSGGVIDEYRPDARVSQCMVAPALYELLLPGLCATQRLGMPRRERFDDLPPEPLAWDAGPAWRLVLKVEKGAEEVAVKGVAGKVSAGKAVASAAKTWQVRGALVRGEESVELRDVPLCIVEGLAVVPGKLVRLSAQDASGWIKLLMNQGSIDVPVAQQEMFLDQLWRMPNLPEVILPEEINYEQIRLPLTPRLDVTADSQGKGKASLVGSVSYLYGPHRYGHTNSVLDTPAPPIVDREKRQVIVRDSAAEQAAFSRLLGLPGIKGAPSHEKYVAKFSPKELIRIVRDLSVQGWQIEADGKAIRRPGVIKLAVKSAVDWFELEGKIDFEGAEVGLPELLAALKRGDSFVTLGDGTQGMLPEEWLNKYAGLADLGRVEGDNLRFAPSQAMILDALLATQPEADVDAAFKKIRERLASFAGVTPVQEPATFKGELRPYQREGLGWLLFLREFGFGGCLADDMGLGKTVQVLAMLDMRRAEKIPKRDRRPSLVVVPRSLVHNWLEEAARFAPQLKVLDFSGTQRSKEELSEYDLVISTYGTLLRDIVDLKEFEFDYAILDESQAIKNAGSQSAKAVRLIQAKHRLAMTGTPVENHLGELWSLFEFLNPGMLGRSTSLKTFAAANGRHGDREAVDLLAHALRPFLLRRTKAKVLAELPEKTEQTLVCELDKKQRKYYDELKKHYQAQLTQRIATDGLGKSKIHVLEALLRLRQAACHPGLIDPKKIGEPSAKLETLLEQLHEVLEEGHKALVFSQFTSLLDIVRKELDREKIVYEYLDGQTRDRKARVERFQTDPDCSLFLISLKAGGVGLNLTAADYVFILDPWWNPAVEAQAVDRAHRIGQTKRVFAYRLIAKDTVEEKILELQRGKRDLADAIISADNSLLASLTSEDLAMLLS